MEVAAAASGETAKSAVVHLEREFGYVLHFNRNVTTLRDLQRRLAAALNDVQTLITAALNNDELIRQTVQDWLSRAGSVHEEANQLIAEAEHVNSWFKGWCCSRFSLGRRAEKKNALILGLLDERSAIGDTVADPKPFQALPIPSDPDFDVFASRERLTKQVIEALRNEKISLVGVHGMPGVGKTMLIKAIAKQVKDQKLFEEVVIVIVSQNPSLEKIQGDIATGLGLNLTKGDASHHRAARLSDRLNTGKAVLIVLDDVWKELDLAAVGIPLKSNNSNGCKVVFTTREASVCNQMEADASFGVPVLTKEDSWILFCQKAGDVVNSVVPELSREIVSECEGLPLAIATLGKTLRNTYEVAVWNYALTQLKESMVDDRVFASIRVSYNFLPNETAKICFLFCSLFPEDFEIDTEVLLRYMIGEDHISEVLLRNVDSVEKSRALLQSLVDKLVSSNLLFKVGHREVMMHDVVRDVAISIASEDEKLRFIVKAGMGLAHWPNVNSNCKRLSVMKNKLRCDLPYKIQAPQLLTLSMRDNKDLVEIPDDFFNEMGNLLTLDISETGISSLPPSLSRLVNLRTLLIETCKLLEDIYLIEGLEKLEILSFKGSHVRHPFEIDTGKLRNLKSLGVSFSRGISAKKFVNMCQLEELYMFTLLPFAPSPVDAQYMFTIALFASSPVNAHLSGVVSLTRLTFLECWLPEIHLSADLPNLEKLIRFCIVCGDDRFSNVGGAADYLSSRPGFQRSLWLRIPKERFPLANWVLVLIARTEYLVLKEIESIESVGELDGTGMNGLKYLRVSTLKNMKYLINSMAGKAPKDAFSSLEELEIEIMNSFEALCNGEFTDKFLCKLRVLEIHNCPQLEYVFQLKVARGLLQLQWLRVTDCPKLKTIIEGSIDEGSSNGRKDTLIFPQLGSLQLVQLPELSRLSPPGLNIDCPHLIKIQVRGCLKLKKLPFRSDSLPKMQRLLAQQLWLDELEWDDEEAKHHLYEAFFAEE